MKTIILTGCIFSGIITGWLLGSMNAQASTQTKNYTTGSKNIILSSISLKGESLPTILLSEFLVTADKNNK